MVLEEGIIGYGFRGGVDFGEVIKGKEEGDRILDYLILDLGRDFFVRVLGFLFGIGVRIFVLVVIRSFCEGIRYFRVNVDRRCIGEVFFKDLGFYRFCFIVLFVVVFLVLEFRRVNVLKFF